MAIVLDAKRSLISAITPRHFKANLPRVIDAVHDALDLQCTMDPDESQEFLVLDFVDAFWLVPLLPTEQRFFVGKVRNKYYTETGTALGW